MAYISILCLSKYKAESFLIYLFWFRNGSITYKPRCFLMFISSFNNSNQVVFLFCCSSISCIILCNLKNSVWVLMYLSVHILCMNDCTLPIHLNSILHITSTLIWAIKCTVCLCILFSFLTVIDRYANWPMNFIHVAITTK